MREERREKRGERREERGEKREEEERGSFQMEGVE